MSQGRGQEIRDGRQRRGQVSDLSAIFGITGRFRRAMKIVKCTDLEYSPHIHTAALRTPSSPLPASLALSRSDSSATTFSSTPTAYSLTLFTRATISINISLTSSPTLTLEIVAMSMRTEIAHSKSVTLAYVSCAIIVSKR